MPHPAQQNWKNALILAGLFAFTVALLMIPSHRLLVAPRGQAFDLFWIWAGGQAILSGQNPYGPETTHVIQLAVFNTIIPPHQYQHGFPHPAHIAFILLPFVALPFSWSVLVWIALQIPLFMAILLLGCKILEWQIRPVWLFLLTIVTLLGFRYPVNVYVLGQLIFFVLACMLLAVWLYRQGHPRWAAIALAGATIRPDLALLALVLAAIFTYRSPQRNSFWLTVLAAGAVLTLLPALFIGPLWPVTWISAIFSYGSNPFATWPPELLPWPAAIAAIAGAFIWAGRYVRLGWQNPTLYGYSLMASAVTLLGLLILPQTGNYTLTFALIPAVVLLRYAPARWLQLLITASLLTPWLYFTLGQPFDRLIFLLIPAQFIILQEIVVYLNRHQSP